MLACVCVCMCVVACCCGVNVEKDVRAGTGHACVMCVLLLRFLCGGRMCALAKDGDDWFLKCVLCTQ